MKKWIHMTATVVLGSLVLIGCSNENQKRDRLKSSIDFTNPEAVRSSEAFGVYEDGWAGTDVQVQLGNKAHNALLAVEGINVQTKTGDERMTLTVVVGFDTLEQNHIAQLGNFRHVVVLPLNLARQDSLEVRLISSKSFVPSKLGSSKDDRQLAFRLSRLSLLPADTAKVSFPEYFEFPSLSEENLNCRGIFADGWISDSATVTVFNPSGKSTVEIRGVVPGNVYTGIATLDVLMQGTTVVKHQVKGEFRIRFDLPDKVRELGKVTFVLKPGSVFSPVDKGISTDKRRLSYQVSFVGLR